MPERGVLVAMSGISAKGEEWNKDRDGYTLVRNGTGATMVVHPRIPVSTYRIQLNHSCTFRDVVKRVSYLHDLGITDLYCSPYFASVPGSMHGYDVVDPTVLNPEIGTEEDYGAMVSELHQRGMGQLLDVVPNHMSIALQINRWWQDVLENGPSSTYASFFDIDWASLKAELRDKVLLPILVDHYGVVLEDQQLHLAYENGRFLIRYYQHCLPIGPKSSARILSHQLDSLKEKAGAAHSDVLELESIITALRHLPSRHDRTPESIAELYREKEITRRRLATLVESSATIRMFIEENVHRFNGTKGDPASFDLLDELLSRQAYRLCDWRVASEEINYRRFFDINELAAIRMENPAVFAETHTLLLRLVKDGAVSGLRIDHVDGLYDPADYLNKLQEWARKELSATAPTQQPLYVVVEKILAVNEELPANWPVNGTTGYEFLNWLNALFVDRAAERAFDNMYARLMGSHEPFEELTYRCKQLIMQASLSSELNVLGHQLDLLSERGRRSRDFTLNSLTHALKEIIACFPVYRTYMTGEPDGVLTRDRTFVWQAVTKAKRRNPAVSGLVFDFVRNLLLGTSTLSDLYREECLKFVTKFQQTTSPVTAKGIEDTAFYRYNRFVSLNEVGSDPQQFGITPELVHRQLQGRRARWPAALSTTSTHDTKRSEDVRARLNVLSEMPKHWNDHVARWKKANRRFKAEVQGESVPGQNEEYLLYQTLMGAWPLERTDQEDYARFIERIQAYMIKAAKEAKQHTSWVSPDVEYEDALGAFVAKVLDRSAPNAFLEDFLPFQEGIAQVGIYNSLSQLLIKIAAPGVPDFYQGTELWDFSLVDPDNRRPVDFDARAHLLEEMKPACESGSRPALIRDLLDHRMDGRIKMFVTMEGLRYRRDHSAMFQHGDYVPLDRFGEKRDHIFAFGRLHEGAAVVVAVPRLLTSVLPDGVTTPLGEKVWTNTQVVMPAWKERTSFRNHFTGEIILTTTSEGKQVAQAGELFNTFPIALLEKES